MSGSKSGGSGIWAKAGSAPAHTLPLLSSLRAGLFNEAVPSTPAVGSLLPAPSRPPVDTQNKQSKEFRGRPQEMAITRQLRAASRSFAQLGTGMEGAGQFLMRRTTMSCADSTASSFSSADLRSFEAIEDFEDFEGIASTPQVFASQTKHSGVRLSSRSGLPSLHLHRGWSTRNPRHLGSDRLSTTSWKNMREHERTTVTATATSPLTSCSFRSTLWSALCHSGR